MRNFHPTMKNIFNEEDLPVIEGRIMYVTAAVCNFHFHLHSPQRLKSSLFLNFTANVTCPKNKFSANCGFCGLTS